MRHVAVFGDVHGHLRLMFQLCRIWQRKNRVHLDAVLQCGDLGFFPILSRVDHATRRYARSDPEELAFASYFVRPDPLERDTLLEQILRGPADSLDTVRCPVVWCHGNHEDFQELERLTSGGDLVPVDAFDKLYLLKSGCVTDIAGLRVGAIGGGSEEDADEDGRNAWASWQSINDDACLRLCELSSEQPFDILLSHGSPKGIGGHTDRWGSKSLRFVVEECQPRYHFYAHHTSPIPPAVIGRTQRIWLNDVEFQREARGRRPTGALNDGCMGLLAWNSPENLHFEILGEPWLKQVTPATWRFL